MLLFLQELISLLNLPKFKNPLINNRLDPFLRDELVHLLELVPSTKEEPTRCAPVP